MDHWVTQARAKADIIFFIGQLALLDCNVTVGPPESIVIGLNEVNTFNRSCMCGFLALGGCLDALRRALGYSKELGTAKTAPGKHNRWAEAYKKAAELHWTVAAGTTDDPKEDGV